MTSLRQRSLSEDCSACWRCGRGAWPAGLCRSLCRSPAGAIQNSALGRRGLSRSAGSAGSAGLHLHDPAVTVLAVFVAAVSTSLAVATAFPASSRAALAGHHQLAARGCHLLLSEFD